MTHLPYVAATYALGVALPFGFLIAGLLRMRGAARKLRAVDPRQNR